MVIASGCGLGQRPTLGSPGAGTPGGPTGDARVDALLAKLDTIGTQKFTATYKITQRLNAATANATVAQDPGRTAVTVGSVLYLKTGPAEKTCDMKSKACALGLDETKISNLSVTASFYAKSPATQIRVSYNRREGTLIFTTQQLAGVTTDCMTIPFNGGTEIYCIAPNGLIARAERQDTLVELTSVVDSVKVTAFRTPA